MDPVLMSKFSFKASPAFFFEFFFGWGTGLSEYFPRGAATVKLKSIKKQASNTLALYLRGPAEMIFPLLASHASNTKA